MPPHAELHDRGARGAAIEAAARVYLECAGLRAVAANAYFRSGELDLVMVDPTARLGSTLVFVEVRYRRGRDYGGGAASIDRGKRRRLVRAARLFLATHREWRDAPCRFDVVEAEGDPDAPVFTWLRDAFRADDA